MRRRNEEVAGLLQEYADLIAITGGDAFKVRVYEKAARSVGGYGGEIDGMDAAALREIPNVGASIAAKIEEYLRTGSIHQLEELRTKIPAGVRLLTTIPTLGPKKAMVLYHERGIDSIERLEHAIHAGDLRGLHGFGEKTEENLLHGIEVMRKTGSRVHIGIAMAVAEEVVAALTAQPGCERCAYAGSLRRMKDTIGDVDVLATARDPAALMAAFTTLPYVTEVIAHGETKSSVRTASGLQADLRVVPGDSWGAALQYFTGSKAHNIRTREIAVHRKLKLSEYGVFDVATGDKITSADETEVYGMLGLPWIEPALREDTGEIEAALGEGLPTLVTPADVRGDLHTHTDLTDGLAPLEEMAEAAAARGYAYYAVTDHAPNLYMQRMTDEKALDQRERLRRLGAALPGLTLLHGCELNIGPEGEVDWPPEFLAGFDLCVASVHSHFTQSPEEMTRRLIRACENPYVKIIGHPTARVIGRREPVDADWPRVFDACARTGTALEIDAFPDRLDLPADLVRRAAGRGVLFAIDSDAHAVPHLANMRYGVGTAQRGWLTPEQVVNTWPLDRLREFLRPR
ncbi:DNA polymerase/3'-5' exonuclease PolX [Microbispora rosea subsp. aerata]|nr:DNA polymerase/3'-5' exonuclease PolX [Microbispora rosea]GGO16700.1 DNA polymerase/3'-5' exonuclease PolX [Microbispora rosea subsp. aerata]GIH56015.1 DNA polymerase/3'-5' exonuclease PolX [Microbispora rosea subsp. aerata]GLJ86911.1 DNA polymerase/3'-5' exonuclease PolX [Microbispora rosea subsp. aerata]